MRARNGARYTCVSYSAMALFARLRFLDFCRIVEVVRDGRLVRRMINSPDVHPWEREGRGMNVDEKINARASTPPSS